MGVPQAGDVMAVAERPEVGAVMHGMFRKDSSTWKGETAC